MKTLFLIVSGLISTSVFGGIEYYGALSTEAILEYEAKIEIDSNSRSATATRAVIDEQVAHLVGHLQAYSYTKNGGFPGVLGDKYEIKINKSKMKADGTQQVDYKFKGKVNFHAKAFKTGNSTTVNLKLPLNPSTIYSFGLVGDLNECTDEHYNSDGDFFYFWDPEMPKCPLKGGKNSQVVYVPGKLTKLANTTKTYPEFDRLYNKDKLTVSVMIGFIDEVIRGRIRTSDDGYKTYKELKQTLIDRGFKVSVEKKRFKLDGRGFGQNGNAYSASLISTITNSLGRKQDIEVKLLLADTEVSSRDRTFELHYAEALKKSDIVAYDGHSGLGGNLDLASISKVGFGTNYQIIFMNGCSSYPYFNNMYFGAKPGGRKNLELITTGLPTLSNTSLSNMLAFINPFIEGKIQSYQTLLGSLEKSNNGEGTYLMGVIGDDDNKFQP